MGRILISEEEKQRILGMHVNKGYNSFINEQATNTQQTQDSGQKSPIQVNLAIFDKYIPNSLVLANWVNTIGSGTTAESLTREDTEVTKLFDIIRKIENNIPEKSVPPKATDDNTWLDWWKNKGIVVFDAQGKFTINGDVAKKVFTEIANKYNFDDIKNSLGVIYQFAKENPNGTLRGPEFKKYYTDKGKSYNQIWSAVPVATAVGLIGKNQDLTPLRNLS
jgi:hypothetical protein